MTTHKKAAGVKVHHAQPKKHPKQVQEDKGPEYMVQINDPKMLRKDVLESLREVIIFMQGYDKFRRIQEEKVALFSALKADIRELNNMLDNKLRKYLPQGKLRGLVKPALSELREETSEEEAKVEIVAEEPKKTKAPAEEKVHVGNLDELEAQLRDIEQQLDNVQ